MTHLFRINYQTQGGKMLLKQIEEGGYKPEEVEEIDPETGEEGTISAEQFRKEFLESLDESYKRKGLQ